MNNKAKFWQPEFNQLVREVYAVFEFGANKHNDGESEPNFLKPDGHKCTTNESAKCALNHVAEGYYSHSKDAETRMHPFAHAIANLMIRYVREKRQITHPDDREEI